MSQTTVPYNHRAVEQKWRKVWEDKPINVNDGKKPKYYCLDMFCLLYTSPSPRD